MGNKEKAITIKNPWAHLICSGYKDIENRTWRTNYRGRVLIHAAQSWDVKHREMSLMFTPEQWHSLSSETAILMTHGKLPCSAIIGEVDIVDCIRDSKSAWAISDHWHWILKNPELYDEPVLNIKGALSFWNYECK